MPHQPKVLNIQERNMMAELNEKRARRADSENKYNKGYDEVHKGHTLY